jgi:hypothetical protein
MLIHDSVLSVLEQNSRRLWGNLYVVIDDALPKYA